MRSQPASRRSSWDVHQGVPGPEPAGGMQIKARGDFGETEWVAPPPGGGIRWQGHIWEQGTFGSMVKRVLLRSPILVEGYFRLSKPDHAKWSLPKDSFLVHMEKGGPRGPGFARSMPCGGELGANSDRAARSALEVSQPWGRGDSGPGSPRGNLLGQATNEVVQGPSTSLASRKQLPGIHQPKWKSGG